MNLELVQIIAPFETDSDLCFVNANGLLKTCLCSQQMEFVFRHVLICDDEKIHALLICLTLLLVFIRTDIKVQEWNADRHEIQRGIKLSLLKLHNI